MSQSHASLSSDLTRLHGQPAHVLVIDDDKVSRLTIAKVLEKEGFRVTQAENGRVGFSAFLNALPDLILMDVLMPEMDGFATTEAIRNYEKERAIPILMLTALEDITSIDRAFQAGATDFITKPINWSLLSQRVKYAIKASLTEDALRVSQAQLSFAQQLAKLAYWEWDAVNDRVSGTGFAFELFGIPNQADVTLEQFLSNIEAKDKPLVQQAIADASQGYNDIQVSFRVHHHEGAPLHIDLLGEVFFNDRHEMVKVIGSAQDISRLHKAESLIDYQASHDKLTDLANRSFFTKALNTFLNEARPDRFSATVIFDIDSFKKINDNLGQEQGDELLRKMAQRLNRVTREDDFVARLGSDEFAIIIKNAQDEQELGLSLTRLFQALSKPYQITSQELFITLSMGISLLHQDGAEASELIAHANMARTQAKQDGGNKYLYYQAQMNAHSKEQLILENDLRKALERNEIEVYYQPQVDGQTLKPYGAEALVRWNHPEAGVISPGIFIPIAESSGLIDDIGHYVLKTAMHQAKHWHQNGYDDLHIGVNLSGRQFSHNDLIRQVQTLLTESGLPPRFLDLEITESLAMSNADHNISILKSLKAMGVSLSIDDFGTGYSSLAYLQSFPIDTIKIDRSFIVNLETNEGQAIVRTILAMAESLNLQVVAEGIEEEFHIAFLQNKNCAVFQGFKFGKPMPADAFDEFLRHNGT
ncbi:EAL domain-containing protein [Thiomicrospira sp. WB1]|uniref:two-component system response regulator n=1 Tax=Thiomicrospira sp. WB1 TaxID=1685380 RepID=UPI00074AC3EE|nr:EAL domain-containing protein [Thiomicrospira sp. WB1]KUJ71226.1 diguanylate cyclase [Thiomicrospira sp. WB1]